MEKTISTFVCTQCGFVGKPSQKAKGSGFIELVLWLAFLVPGIIYSIWRRSSPPQICTQCKSTAVIPVDSPRAKKILEESGQNQEDYLESAKIERKKIYTNDRNKKIFWVVLISLLVLAILYAQSQAY